MPLQANVYANHDQISSIGANLKLSNILGKSGWIWVTLGKSGPIGANLSQFGSIMVYWFGTLMKSEEDSTNVFNLFG